MRRKGIDFICGQEAGLNNDFTMKRWDTGELLISCGKSGSNRAKASGCFFLSAKMAQFFTKGGSKRTTHGDRLSTIQIPLRRRTLHVINSHFPDSANKKRQEVIEYRNKIDGVLRKVKKRDLLLWMGDFNASTGIATSKDDVVCGPYGNPHMNPAGRELKTIAAINGLLEVSTFTYDAEQMGEGTWVHPRSKKWFHLDKVFMRATDLHLVNKCHIANMIVDSDHYSMFISINTERCVNNKLTTRQVRNGKDFETTFGKSAENKTTLDALSKNHEAFISTEGKNSHERLMSAVNKATEHLPTKSTRVSGWCDKIFLKLLTRSTLGTKPARAT